jgi:hypothetical protein
MALMNGAVKRNTIGNLKSSNLATKQAQIFNFSFVRIAF